MDSSRENRIRAQGVVQAVIASGAPADEWASRARFAMRVVNYMAAGLDKKKPKEPKVPDALAYKPRPDMGPG